jgi:hypothetical protein
VKEQAVWVQLQECAYAERTATCPSLQVSLDKQKTKGTMAEGHTGNGLRAQVPGALVDFYKNLWVFIISEMRDPQGFWQSNDLAKFVLKNSQTVVRIINTEGTGRNARLPV